MRRAAATWTLMLALFLLGAAWISRADAESAACPSVQKGVIQTCNTARLRPDRYWDWELFLVADDETLRKIKCVEYTLHPTFPNPVRKNCQKGTMPERGFALKAAGWGTFRVNIKVIFADGREEYHSHQLSFQ
jgi:transcription initiation factor IIF auxiliary subunit